MVIVVLGVGIDQDVYGFRFGLVGYSWLMVVMQCYFVCECIGEVCVVLVSGGVVVLDNVLEVNVYVCELIVLGVFVEYIVCEYVSVNIWQNVRNSS